MSEPEPLARLLAAIAHEDAATLLEEARAAAHDRVRERLTDELTRRLLDEVAEGAGPRAPRPAEVERPRAGEPRPVTPPPEPEPAVPAAEPPAAATPAPAADPEPTGERGVYVYAVVDRPVGDAGLPEGVASAPVRGVPTSDGALVALVSDVSLDEFGDEALRRNLNELDWLAATAVAHEHVVDAALKATTVVPMRLCTIFRDDDAVRQMLARERGDLDAALARLQGAHEWGVKVVADGEALNDAVARESERLRELRRGMAAVGEGAGYFASRELERATREEAEAQLQERTRAIHDALAGIALDARVNPPSNRDLAGYQGDMVLNGAYLVDHDRTEDLRALVARLDEEHRGHGLSLDLTGPWPPYNFSTLAGAL